MAILKFYKQTDAPSAETGAVWFSSSESVIKVYNGTVWEAFAGKVTDVTYDETTNKLTLIRPDGTKSEIELKKYTAGDGISISENNEISALDEKIGVDLVVTQATGALNKDKSITSDMTLKDILIQMLQQVKQPGTPTAPKLTITLTNAGAKEVGTTVTPAYTTSFNAGSYTYGPATGVTATGYSISDGTTTKDTATGSFGEITVGDSTNYKLTATANYSDGVVAKDNTGATSNPEVKISAGTTATATSAAITGFRSWFIGTSTEALASTAYTSAFVRSLTNKNSAPNTNAFTITVSAGAQRVFVAVPTG